MDWTQTIALGGTLIAYMTGMCLFFYHLSEKGILETRETIKEWRNEHKHQMDRMENKWEYLFERLLLQDKRELEEMKKREEERKTQASLSLKKQLEEFSKK